jgi:hypothetical protein
MSTAPKSPAADGLPPAATAYLLAGLAAVAVLGFALMQTVGRWAVVPTLIGAAGMAFRWRSAPLVLLAAVALGQLGPSFLFGPYARFRTSLPTEVVLCAAVVAYVAAQYRLLGLTAGVFGPDPRRPRDKPPPRDATRVPPTELVAVLLAVAAAAVGAFFLWEVLGEVRPPWLVPPAQWRLGLLAWVLVGAAAVTAAVIGYLGWRRQSPAEAAVYLRDELWRETRGDQRRINRWRVWGVRRRG